ncbi:MAG: glycosyltransferase [Patescibacteria group bacterium]
MISRIGHDHQYILYLSTFPPRECGIATFTQDLATAFDRRFNPAVKARVFALNEEQTTLYNYAPRVMGAIGAKNIENYVALAEQINADERIRVVNIQHEFGIFGGEWGSYLIPFLQVIKKPLVVTFHSILPKPDDNLRHTVCLIGDKAQRLIVMNQRSGAILTADYGIPQEKIALIPHGIPQTTFEVTKSAKEALGLKGNLVLSTFGLISRDKGIEYAIRALTPVVKKFPNVRYLVLGATHPVVRRSDGEAYRNFLYHETQRLNLGGHVQFYDKYLTIDEIISYLKASDIYISTAVNPRQSVSGTLSYALGCGRAAVSTPTEYARHIIDDKNGVLVKFRNSKTVSDAVIELLSDEKRLHAMHRHAYETTRRMTWPNVAGEYFRVYRDLTPLRTEEKKLPDIKLEQMMRLTDKFGVLHHARYAKPEKRFGYSLDDNARALIVATRSYTLEPRPETLSAIKTYLSFIRFVQRPDGRFSRIVTSQKEPDNAFDEDVQGRGIWALGVAASADAIPPKEADGAREMFQRAIPDLSGLSAPRAMAFAMTGLYHYLRRYPDNKIHALLTRLADRQLELYKKTASPDWHWFEDCLTYSNSKLSEALFLAYDLTKKPAYLDAAEKTLAFLSRVTFEPKHYSPIGQNGWYFRYKKRAYFDQQPEDTASMVETKIAAWRVTGKKQHLADAFTAFQWFLGKNHLKQMVYDEVTGGCHDGLDRYAMNLNQGAESTLSYLLARLAFEQPGVTPTAP